MGGIMPATEVHVTLIAHSIIRFSETAVATEASEYLDEGRSVKGFGNWFFNISPGAASKFHAEVEFGTTGDRDQLIGAMRPEDYKADTTSYRRCARTIMSGIQATGETFVCGGSYANHEFGDFRGSVVEIDIDWEQNQLRLSCDGKSLDL